MKKLLGIIVLSLLLVSCSEYSDNKKMKKINKCANPKAIQSSGWGLDKNGNIKVGSLSPKLRKKVDPLELFKEDRLLEFDKLTLETKFADKVYETIWTECERELSLTPLKFKEKYLK